MQYFGVLSRMTSDQRAFATDNRQRVFGRFTARCNSLIIKQLRQYTRWFQNRVQQFWSQTTSPVHLILSRLNAVNSGINRYSSDCDKAECNVLTSKQLSVHLITLASDAALTISLINNCQRASDGFTVKYSSSDIIFNRQCIWWHRHQMQLLELTLHFKRRTLVLHAQASFVKNLSFWIEIVKNVYCKTKFFRRIKWNKWTKIMHYRKNIAWIMKFKKINQHNNAL